MQSAVMYTNNESLEISRRKREDGILLDLALSKYSMNDEYIQWQGVLPSPEPLLKLVVPASCACTITVVSLAIVLQGHGYLYAGLWDLFSPKPLSRASCTLGFNIKRTIVDAGNFLSKDFQPRFQGIDTRIFSPT
jgi:hypothetical protein